jgi:hypothetical protein
MNSQASAGTSASSTPSLAIMARTTGRLPCADGEGAGFAKPGRQRTHLEALGARRLAVPKLVAEYLKLRLQKERK